jgi:isocitrate/isopropylmalate dehydrogenase
MRSAAKLLQQVFELNDAEEIKKAVQKAVDMQATSTQA